MIRQPSARALALDSKLAEHVKTKRIAAYHLARVLAEIEQSRIHQEFGYANIADYANERHGIPGCAALRRLGERLPGLPLLDRAMADGQIGWTKAARVAAVATPETEAEWLAFASGVTSRVLERAVPGRAGGLPPTEAELADLPDLVLETLRMTNAQHQVFRTTLTWFRTLCGITVADLDDGALLAMILQRFLADADPENAPSPDRSRFVVVNPPAADADPTESVHPEATCDVEVVEMGHGPKRGHVTHTIPPATRRAVLYRDDHKCRVPGCSNWLWLEVHHVKHKAHGGSHKEENLVSTCGIHHDLIHEDRIGVRAENGGFWFTFPDGKEQFVPRSPHRPSPTPPPAPPTPEPARQHRSPRGERRDPPSV